MASDLTHIEGVGEVKIFRRRGLKNIRISINRSGQIRLSIPWYVPKSYGVKYIQTKKEWIRSQKNQISKNVLKSGDHLTPKIILNIERRDSTRSTTVLKDNQLDILIPTKYSKARVQTATQKAVNNFLKKESEKIISERIKDIADHSGYTYKSLKYKNLKSRWGSCDSHKNITLNIHLIRLDDEYIDYVIIHELAHTKHLNHSPNFWQDVHRNMPSYKSIRKKLKDIHPAVNIDV